MAREILINAAPFETRVALVERLKLVYRVTLSKPVAHVVSVVSRSIKFDHAHVIDNLTNDGVPLPCRPTARRIAVRDDHDATSAAQRLDEFRRPLHSRSTRCGRRDETVPSERIGIALAFYDPHDAAGRRRL